jgi:triosephosphate isomerase
VFRVAGIFVINFKAYETAFSFDFISKVVEEAERIRSSTGVRVILAVPSVVALKLRESYDDIYLEHVDPVGFGAHTGRIPPGSLKILGIKGSLVNHSEHKMVLRDVFYVIKEMKGAGLEVLACGDTPGEVAALAYASPDMIAVEPPELIGTGIPVSRARPEVITESLKALRKVNEDIPLLAGAGITSGEDVARAVELGAKGILVASAVMKAKNPSKVMRELAEPLSSV